jgi:hypothetical protein
MNLFFLDRDLDRCAEYHIDKHVTKMVLEAAQLLTTTVWVDKYVGYVPRKLTSEELGVINEVKRQQPSIENRTFTRYLPTHPNHPSAIWVRSSLEHFYWTINYANALTDEGVYRGFKRHASCEEVNKLPEPTRLVDAGWADPTLAMPEHLKGPDHIQAYRMFYMLDKYPFASWKVRGKPYWWDDNIVEAQRNRGERISGR